MDAFDRILEKVLLETKQYVSQWADAIDQLHNKMDLFENYLSQNNYELIQGSCCSYGDYFVFANNAYIIGGFYQEEIWIAYFDKFDKWSNSRIAEFDYPFEEYQLSNLDHFLTT